MSSSNPLQCPACGYRGNEETCPQCGFPLGQYRDFLSGIPVLADEAWKRELEELIQRHRTIYQERMAREGAVRALMQTARRLEKQGNWAGALETYRQALGLARADPSLRSLAQEIEPAIQDVQKRHEQAQKETKAQRPPKEKAIQGEISQDIWRSIANLPFVEQLKVPATGEKVKSKSVLERGKDYTIVAKGTYEYAPDLDKGAQPADAKDALLINEAKLEPIASYPGRHEYVFLITGAGERVSFRVSKTAHGTGCLFILGIIFVLGSLLAPLFPPWWLWLIIWTVAFISGTAWGYYKKRLGLTEGGLLVEIREGSV